MKSLIRLLLLLAALPVFAQIPVQTRLIDGQGNPLPQAYLQFELKNCGNNFPVFAPMPALTIDRKFVMRPNSTTGIVTGQLLPTDQITCGNIASTAWIVTPMRDSATPLQPSQTYRVLSTEYSSLIPFDPTLALPLSGPLPAPGFQSLFANPTKNQTMVIPSGTSMIFKGGTVDLTQTTVLCTTCGGGGGGGGGVGDMLLHPPTDQIMQPLPNFRQFFDCPTGSVGSTICYGFRSSGQQPYLVVQADGTVVQGDGFSGTQKLARVIHGVGTVAATGFIGLTSTDLLAGFKSNLGSGDDTIGQDNLDQLLFSGFAAYRDNLGQYFARNPAYTRCQPITAQSVGVNASSPWMVDANCGFYVDPGGDSCKTLKNAVDDAVSLGNVDVYAQALNGSRACTVNPISDAFQGNIFLGHVIFWLRSNVAMWRTHGRVHIIGTEGRAATGPTGGTTLALCNNDNTACNGATYNPTANNYCYDGDDVTVPCPILTWSLGAENGLPSQQMFASTVEGVNFNCNSIPGAIGWRNGMFPYRGHDPSGHPQTPVCTGKCGAQENSFVKNSRVENCGNAGTGAQMLPGSSNFQVDGINFLNEQQTIADCSAFHAIDVLFDNSVVANGPKRIDDITNTNGACTIKPVDSALIDAGEVQVKGYHTENTTSSGVVVGRRANSIGDTFINVNGVGSNSSSATLRIAAGNIVGLTALSTVNVNPAGYTIKDEYHGEEVRVDSQSDTALYAFGAGIADQVVSDAPSIPKVLTMGPPFITNVILAAGDVVRLVPASTTYQVTKNNAPSNLTAKPIGISLAAITDTAVRVPVATYGIVGVGGIPGPIVDTAMPDCHAGYYVFYGPTTDGKVQCSATRPTNVAILGTALNDASAGAQLAMFLNPLEPGQPAPTQCSTTGTSANPSVMSCGSSAKGLVKCAHAASAGNCEVDTTAVKAGSLIKLTPDTSITTGCDVPTAPLYVSVRNTGCTSPATACFFVPAQTLSSTNGLCFGYDVDNIN